MRVLYVFADSPVEWNCSEWRCAIPARALNRSGRHAARLLSLVEFAQESPRAREDGDWADVIVVQRNLVGPVLAAIERWQARGKPVLVDFDDAYHLIPPSNPAYGYWRLGRPLVLDGPPPPPIYPPPLEQFRRGLRLVDGATVPSRRLAADYRDLARIELVPNYLDLEVYREVPRPEHEGIVIGWGGSLSHVESFKGSGLLPALRRVCRARPQVRVVINGGDRRIFEQLPLPSHQKVLRPWVRFRDWPRELAGYDIGLAPLHGAYDQRRSWIKVLEYMVMQVPWVASEGAPYQGLRDFGLLVPNSARAWERALLEVIDHLEDYRARARGEAYQFALSQGVDENVERIVAAYERLMAAALRRVPSA